jgi:isoleucyl-tRNA synthetase
MPYSWNADAAQQLRDAHRRRVYRGRGRTRRSPSLHAARGRDRRGGPLSILVWTTTPWTLPSNLALAVGPEIDYASCRVRQGRRVRYVLGAGAARRLHAKETRRLRADRRALKDQDLVGRTYEPLFPYFAGRRTLLPRARRRLRRHRGGHRRRAHGPGFGEDDQKVCEANGIELVCPVDARGRFTAEVPDWQGVHVFDANKDIIKVLKERGVLLRTRPTSTTTRTAGARASR